MVRSNSSTADSSAAGLSVELSIVDWLIIIFIEFCVPIIVVCVGFVAYWWGLDLQQSFVLAGLAWSVPRIACHVWL